MKISMCANLVPAHREAKTSCENKKEEPPNVKAAAETIAEPVCGQTKQEESTAVVGFQQHIKHKPVSVGLYLQFCITAHSDRPRHQRRGARRGGRGLSE